MIGVINQREIKVYLGVLIFFTRWGMIKIIIRPKIISRYGKSPEKTYDVPIKFLKVGFSIQSA